MSPPATAFEAGARQGRNHGRLTLGAGLAFKKNRTHVPRLGDGVKRALVNWLVRFAGEIKNFIRQTRRHKTEKFVGSKH